MSTGRSWPSSHIRVYFPLSHLGPARGPLDTKEPLCSWVPLTGLSDCRAKANSWVSPFLRAAWGCLL